MRGVHDRRPTARPAHPGGSNRRIAREPGRACKAGRTNDDTRNPPGPAGKPVCCPHAKPSASTSVTSAGGVVGGRDTKAIGHDLARVRSLLASIVSRLPSAGHASASAQHSNPVLAGVACVASQPDHWAESLLGAVPEVARSPLAQCLKNLSAGRVWGPERRGKAGESSHLLPLN